MIEPHSVKADCPQPIPLKVIATLKLISNGALPLVSLLETTLSDKNSSATDFINVPQATLALLANPYECAPSIFKLRLAC